MSSGPIVVDATNAADAARGLKAGREAERGPTTVRRSAALMSLTAAMVKAQAEAKNPTRDSVNLHFKSRYADLAAVRDAVVPAMNRHGLVVLQLPCEWDDAPALTTLILHVSGEWVETTIKLRPGKADPQGVGSALTYLRRYCLLALAGVAADDDDGGEAASPHHQREPAPVPRENPGLRGRYAQRVAQCPDRAALDALGAEVKAAAAAGEIGPADVTNLRLLFAESGKRFPQ